MENINIDERIQHLQILSPSDKSSVETNTEPNISFSKPSDQDLSNSMMLRNRTFVNSDYTMSDTLFVKGITRRVTEDELLLLFSAPHQPIESDFSCKSRGQVWFKYSTIEMAYDMLLKLHQLNFNSAILIVRFELGVDSNGQRIIDKRSHHTVIRSIQVRKGGDNHSKTNSVTYTHRSLLVGDMDYPFPTGLYLTKIIQLTNIYPSDNPLLMMLRDTSFYGTAKYSKEISECMAMADCTQRAVRMVCGYCCSIYDTYDNYYLTSSQKVTSSIAEKLVHPSMPRDVVVYILGDGVRPLCAAAICLHIPRQYHWKYVSIDPLMSCDIDLGDYSDNIEIVRGYSQDYHLDNQDSILSIIVACHSHAPILEFWNRVTTSKIAIIMACCADYANLDDTTHPILEFLDYEVYSPKRKIKIYSSIKNQI